MSFLKGYRISGLRFAGLLALWTGFFAVLPAYGQTLTEQQGDAILEELRQIRQLLEASNRNPAPANVQAAAQRRVVSVNTMGRPVLGERGAPVTIVEFTDYQCPYCNRFFTEVLPGLKQQYLASGQVNLIVKDLPLSFHEFARGAATAAHCAGQQGEYWTMHDMLFSNNTMLQKPFLEAFAEQIGIEPDTFDECMIDADVDALVGRDIAEASRLGITGTPTFVIGRSSGDQVTGVVVRGAQPIDVFRAEIEKLLDDEAL